jgi:hypothetical protein
VTDEEVDKVLQKASGVAPQVQPALLKRIADSINSSVRPVRPAAADMGADRGAGSDLRTQWPWRRPLARDFTELKN